MATTLELRGINGLLSERFVIPSYQRGYRWTAREVTDLLNDIWGFVRGQDATGARRAERPAEPFYCLQPVVVLPRPEGSWELVDGQQRLTTLLLILRHLRPILELLGKRAYSLTYDTRDRSADFLADPTEDLARENIDFHHLFQANLVISDWFSKLDGTHLLDFAKCLTAPGEGNVRVIWYELPAGANPIDAFIRLNVGKIPLTNAELIRALFLRNLDGKDGAEAAWALQIAQDWDTIEKRLQDERYWSFIHDGPSPYPARIEYLFAIKVRALGRHVGQHDTYGTFVAYQDELQAHGTTRERWLEIRQLAMRLDEWFADRTLYHLVGYWVAVSGRPSVEVVVELLSARATRTRSAFEKHIKALIFDALFKRRLDEVEPDQVMPAMAEAVSELTYTNARHKPRIRALLLLFNVATILRNPTSNLRFPFDLYEVEDWDIEHIRSVRERVPERPEEIRDWLARVVEYWDQAPREGSPAMERLRAEALDVIGAGPMDLGSLRRRFEPVYQRILEHFGENDSSEADDGIGNLTLLDARTNRSYKNAVFPVKRRVIIELDKTGTFVPLCTTNAFLKYYGQGDAQLMFWGRHDGVQYRDALLATLAHFFTEASA